MEPDKTTRRTIIAAVDSSKSGPEVVRVATELASAQNAELHFIHCLLLPPEPSQRVTDELERGRDLLETLAKGITFERLSLHLAMGTPWVEIVQLAANLRADMIIVGTHDFSALKQLVIGSVAHQVVTKARCPVMVVRPVDYHRYPVPEIQPPCPECLQTQVDTKGEKLWCARHSTRHVHGHLHYELPDGFAQGSTTLRT